ncbi:MAG: PhaM family polyhydroxyalkanoate granule multifunctional regulatory protein [Polaromonas sp.]
MSNANNPSFPDFGKLVPGFDFLQNLTQQASSKVANAAPQLPNLGSWIAPTLNVEELDKRIQELKAVQFWLDQNAAALKATIQALELQKMTLATLKGMNFNMGEVAKAFKLNVSDSPAGKTDKAKTFAGLEIPPSAFQANRAQADAATESAARTAPPKDDKEAAPAAASAVVDPMQWWGALTNQFQAIAAEAMKEVAKTSALDAGKSMASGIAKDAVKTATDMAKNIAETATKTMAGGTRAAMNTALTSSWPKAGADKSASGAAPRKAAAKTGAAKTAAGKSAPKTASKASPQASARKKAGTAARKIPKTMR